MSERKAPVPWSPDTTREIEYEERVDLLGPDGTWIRLRLDEDGIVALSLKGDWTVRQEAFFRRFQW